MLVLSAILFDQCADDKASVEPSSIPLSGSGAGGNSSGSASTWETDKASGAWLGTSVGVDSVMSVGVERGGSQVLDLVLV